MASLIGWYWFSQYPCFETPLWKFVAGYTFLGKWSMVGEYALRQGPILIKASAFNFHACSI